MSHTEWITCGFHAIRHKRNVHVRANSAVRAQYLYTKKQCDSYHQKGDSCSSRVQFHPLRRPPVRNLRSQPFRTDKHPAITHQHMVSRGYGGRRPSDAMLLEAATPQSRVVVGNLARPPCSQRPEAPARHACSYRFQPERHRHH